MPWNPIWAANWPHFEIAGVRRPPSAWSESVGLPCSPAPEWLMLLRYSSKDLQIYRPTQLEAGSFAYHFPSPPCAECDIGGHPMNLEPSAIWSGMLISEFVHAEIPFTTEHWEAAGSQLGCTPLSSRYDALMAYRRRHHAMLCDEYTQQAIRSWMPDPTRFEPAKAPAKNT